MGFLPKLRGSCGLSQTLAAYLILVQKTKDILKSKKSSIFSKSFHQQWINFLPANQYSGFFFRLKDYSTPFKKVIIISNSYEEILNFNDDGWLISGKTTYHHGEVNSFNISYSQVTSNTIKSISSSCYKAGNYKNNSTSLEIITKNESGHLAMIERYGKYRGKIGDLYGEYVIAKNEIEYCTDGGVNIIGYHYSVKSKLDTTTEKPKSKEDLYLLENAHTLQFNSDGLLLSEEYNGNVICKYVYDNKGILIKICNNGLPDLTVTINGDELLFYERKLGREDVLKMKMIFVNDVIQKIITYEDPLPSATLPTPRETIIFYL